MGRTKVPRGFMQERPGMAENGYPWLPNAASRALSEEDERPEWPKDAHSRNPIRLPNRHPEEDERPKWPKDRNLDSPPSVGREAARRRTNARNGIKAADPASFDVAYPLFGRGSAPRRALAPLLPQLPPSSLLSSLGRG